MAYEVLKSLLLSRQNDPAGSAITVEMVSKLIPDASVDMSTFISTELSSLDDDFLAFCLLDFVKLGHTEVKPIAEVLLGSADYPMAQVVASGVLTILGEVSAFNQLKTYCGLNDRVDDAADVVREIEGHIPAGWKTELYGLF